MTDSHKATIRCPFCQRQFGSSAALANHMKTKRRTSASHGLSETGEPRSREALKAAMEVASGQ